MGKFKQMLLELEEDSNETSQVQSDPEEDVQLDDWDLFRIEEQLRDAQEENNA